MSEIRIPALQRAWSVVRRGVPSKALTLNNQTPVSSKLGPGEVFIQVKAAALNPINHKLMGILPNFAAGRPFTSENDVSGVIIDAGDSEFKIGDRVFGFVDMEFQKKTQQGSLAEYTRLLSAQTALLPPNISFTQGAGLAGSGVAAYGFLTDAGDIESGQSIFINGGSSSVGAFAIQIAKAKGCRVVASASGKNKDFVMGLGADEFFDYTKAPLHEQLVASPPSPKFHMILDAIGDINPSLYTHSSAYLAVGGVFVSSGPMPSATYRGVVDTLRTIVAISMPKWLGGTPREWKIKANEVHKEELNVIRKLVVDGKIKPVVDSVFSFEDTLKAYDRIMTKRARGKVVIRVDSSAE